MQDSTYDWTKLGEQVSGYIECAPNTGALKNRLESSLSHETPEKFPEHSVPRYATLIMSDVLENIREEPDRYNNPGSVATAINHEAAKLRNTEAGLVILHADKFQAALENNISELIGLYGDEPKTVEVLKKFQGVFCGEEKQHNVVTPKSLAQQRLKIDALGSTEHLGGLITPDNLVVPQSAAGTFMPAPRIAPKPAEKGHSPA